LKAHLRVLGIDDSPFAFSGDRVRVVGVLMRVPDYVEGVMLTECTVDGTDADQALVGLINRSRFKEQIRLAIVDGAALGGFNVVDISKVHDQTGLAVATVTREPPDFGSMEQALRKHFDDWESRLKVIKRHPLFRVSTGHKPLYASVAGMDENSAKGLIQASVVRGAVPEPVRIAHLIASALERGESRGKA